VVTSAAAAGSQFGAPVAPVGCLVDALAWPYPCARRTPERLSRPLVVTGNAGGDKPEDASVTNVRARVYNLCEHARASLGRRAQSRSRVGRGPAPAGRGHGPMRRAAAGEDARRPRREWCDPGSERRIHARVLARHDNGLSCRSARSGGQRLLRPLLLTQSCHRTVESVAGLRRGLADQLGASAYAATGSLIDRRSWHSTW
jgi:hypothetical protein